MTFQVLNDRGVCVMQTEHTSCIPNDERLSYMSKIGYKFKIDGKITSAKKIKELRLRLLDVN